MQEFLFHFTRSKIIDDKISDDIKPYHNKRSELTIEDGVILWGLELLYQNN